MKSLELLGVRVDDISDDALLARLSDWLKEEQGRIIVTPNAEMVLLSRRRDVFRDHLNTADLHLPDSVSLRYAVAALTDEYLQYRHTGVDTLFLLAQLCGKERKRMLLLGGAPGSAQKTAKKFRNLVTENVDVHAIDPGDVAWDGSDVVLSVAMEELIRQLEPHVIAVALGQEKQEAFMKRYIPLFPTVSIAIGVGGALDMISGQKRRAPKWMRTVGLEFVWRVLIEPSRIGRIIRASIVFPLGIAFEAVRKRRFIKAVRRVIKEVAQQLSNIHSD